MHIIGLVIAVVLGAAYWVHRARSIREAAETLADSANDVRLAARRFGFRRKINVHPIDSIEDARIVGLSIATAMAQIERTWTREDNDTAIRQAQFAFEIGVDEATEMVVLALWLNSQSASVSDAARRLVKRLKALTGKEALPELEKLIEAIAGPESEACEEGIETRVAMRRVLA